MSCEDPSEIHTGPVYPRVKNTCCEPRPVECGSDKKQQITSKSILRFPMRLTSACAPISVELETFMKITQQNTCYNKFKLGDRTGAFFPQVGSRVKIQGRVWSCGGYDHEMATVIQVNRSTVKVTLGNPESWRKGGFSVDFYSIGSPICKIPHTDQSPASRCKRIAIVP